MAFSQCLSKLFRRKKKDEEKPMTEEKVAEEQKRASAETQKATTEEQAPPTPPSKSPSSNVRGGSRTSSPRKSSSNQTTGTGSKASAKEACCNICMTTNPLPKESKRSKVNKKKSVVSPKKKSSIGGSKDSKVRKKTSVSGKSDRALRVKKKLSSRPIKATALKKMAQRVEARRHDAPRKKLGDGDLVFPQRKNSRSGTTNSDDLTQFRQRTHTDMNSSPRVSKKVESREDQRHFVKNNDNNGELFVKGKKGKMVPFWIKDDSDETEAAEDTENDMVLNADAVLDVLNGTLQLAEVPNVEILFDPFQPLKDMQRKDMMFFTPQVLLGNSLRSMINLTEPVQENEVPCVHIPRKKKSARIKMTDPPEKVTTYNRTKWTEHKQRSWKPSGKKIVY